MRASLQHRGFTAAPAQRRAGRGGATGEASDMVHDVITLTVEGALVYKALLAGNVSTGRVGRIRIWCWHLKDE